jgi:hypothetical protein
VKKAFVKRGSGNRSRRGGGLQGDPFPVATYSNIIIGFLRIKVFPVGKAAVYRVFQPFMRAIGIKKKIISPVLIRHRRHPAPQLPVFQVIYPPSLLASGSIPLLPANNRICPDGIEPLSPREARKGRSTR